MFKAGGLATAAMIDRFVLTMLACLLAVAPAQAARAEPRTEQGQVRKDIRAGNVRSLREIERKVLPTMPHMQVTSGKVADQGFCVSNRMACIG